MSSPAAQTDAPIRAPLQGLSADNKGPWVIVCCYIFLVLAILTIVIKILSRFRASNRLTSNDLFIVAAGLLSLVETILVTLAVHYGLGRHRDKISDSDFANYEKTTYAANILLILSLAAAKASMAQLVIAINPTRSLLMACYGLLGFVAAWAVASILASAFQCNLPQPWNTEDNKCVDLFGLQAGIQSLSILSDLLLVLIPVMLMIKVQVTAGKRFIVISLFASRLAVPAFTVAMLYFLKRSFNSSPPDRTWTSLVPWVFLQIIINISIITACIPSLKPFLADIKPGLIVVNIPEHEMTAGFVRPSKTKSGSTTRVHVKSKGVSRLASKLGLSSRIGNTLNSSSDRSGIWGEKQRQAVQKMELGYNRPHATKATSNVEMDRSESVKGLTDDVILHTIDYRVEFEEANQDDDFRTGSRDSPRNERH